VLSCFSVCSRQFAAKHCADVVRRGLVDAVQLIEIVYASNLRVSWIDNEIRLAELDCELASIVVQP
jgi:hypothetical protein